MIKKLGFLEEPPSRPLAVAQALLVTLLWSSSWVLIKFGLAEIPALTFAGLRYSLAFVCLLPFALRSQGVSSFCRMSGRDWARLIALGVFFYAITQGAQFVGLAYLPALTVSLLLNFTTLFVALIGIVWLSERPTPLQWIGTALALLGAVVYFTPVAFPPGEAFGLAVVVFGVLANALSSVLGRDLNRSGRLPPLLVTVASMGIGSALLLASGFLFQGLPPLSPRSWIYIGWLSLVNTAFAFTLWNQTLRTLQAVESSIINSTMLIQIAVLAWVFLGEEPGLKEVVGMLLVAAGTLIVQLRKRRKQSATSYKTA